jgi:uncharacterized repeat protein (TIGR01451 family)
MKKQVERHACRTGTPVCVSSQGADEGLPERSSVRLVPVLLATVLLLAMAGVTAGKSLYVITQITNYEQPTPIHAYDIGADGLLTFQAEYGAPMLGSGCVGLALDSYSERLFITYESSNTVLSLDAATLSGNRTVTAPGATDLAGIVYDQGRELLYCVDRGTENLYIYKWDAVKSSLTPVEGSPFRLEQATAYGIALDEFSDLLYVANASAKIFVYSTWDWRPVRTITVTRTAISVAVDPQREYLYYGAGFAYNWNLTQYDLAAGVERKDVQVDPDAGVMGLGVDLATGFIYTTTGQNNRPGGDDLLVFDTDLRQVQAIEDIGSATGLVIPVKDTSYNPLRLRKIVADPLGGAPADRELPQVAIGDEFKYAISFDTMGYDLQQVSLVDRLPDEVMFLEAGASGQYDAKTHTCTWSNPPLAPGGRTTVELVCRLLPDVPPGRVFLNLVTIDTDKTPPTTVGAEAVATQVSYKPLNITKTVVTDATGSSTELIYVSPGQTVTYHIAFDNKDNAHTTGNVSIIDTLPPQVDFVAATGNGVFDKVSRTCVWSYPLLSAGEGNDVEITVRVSADAVPGSTITNTATIQSDQTPKKSSSVDVITGYVPLLLRATIVAGAHDPVDDRGRSGVYADSDVTYELWYRNPAREKTITRIVLVNALPPEVNFIAASGSGLYDQKSHTCTWFCTPLGPQAEATLNLTVHVNEQTEPNTVVSNWAQITSKEASGSQARVDAVVDPTPPPVQALMYVKPGRIFRNAAPGSASLAADVQLPVGVGMNLIARTPAVLTPGNVVATSQQIFGTATQGKLLICFDTDAILRATTGYGRFDLTVTGKLTNGGSYVATAPVYILKFGGP